MSADLELQGAIVAALKASIPLQGLIGNPVRLHQDVPANPTFPYVTIGTTQDIPDLAECIDGWEIFVTLHVWSRDSGFAQSKRIGRAIDDALHNASLTLNTHRCLLIERYAARYFLDADPSTKHGVLDFRALVEPTT